MEVSDGVDCWVCEKEKGVGVVKEEAMGYGGGCEESFEEGCEDVTKADLYVEEGRKGRAYWL